MDTQQALLETLGSQRVKVNEPLTLHTITKTGGNASFYFDCQTIEELQKAIQIAHDLKVPYYLLGGGSNVIFSDRGFDGLVIKNNARQFEMRSMKGKIEHGVLQYSGGHLYAESGAIFNQVIRFAIDNGMAGLEGFIDMPGTVGAAVATQAMYGEYTIGDYISRVIILNPKLEIEEVSWSYIASFKTRSIFEKNNIIILGVIFSLVTTDKSETWKTAEKILTTRAEVYPDGVLATGDVFEDITTADAMRIPTPAYTTKASFLLDQVRAKEFNYGNALVNERNVNSIVSRNATSSDIYKLMKKMKNSVKKQFGVLLKENISFVGDFSNAN